MTFELSAEDVKRCRVINLGNRDLIKRIAAAISGQTGTSVAAIFGTSIAKPAVAARHLVMYLARKQGLSYPVIGRAMNRNHTTVRDGVLAEMKRRGELPVIAQ